MKPTYKVDMNRWGNLDIFNQMGNIYSEVGRSLKTKNDLDSHDHTEAITRAIDLFDATIACLVKIKSPKAKEVLRSKEQFLDIATNKDATLEAIQSLDRYFMQFAVAARLHR